MKRLTNCNRRAEKRHSNRKTDLPFDKICTGVAGERADVARYQPVAPAIIVVAGCDRDGQGLVVVGQYYCRRRSVLPDIAGHRPAPCEARHSASLDAPRSTSPGSALC